MLAGYEHFAGLARAFQWDDGAVDLRADAAAWPGLDPELRRRLTTLVAGFCVGEAAVAEHLDPFATSAQAAAGVVFRAQERDEERHARAFDRICAEVLRVPGETAAARLAALRELVSPAFLEAFERRLPAVAGELASKSATLADAVGLYHMVLEGAVFTAGQTALLELLDPDGPLPGLRRAVELVLRDERWHVGFGTRCLLDSGLPPALGERIAREGARGVEAWGAVVPAPVARKTLHVLERRLAVVAAGRREASGVLVRAV